MHVEYRHNNIINFFLKSKESQNHMSYLIFSQVIIGHVEYETTAMAMLFWYFLRFYQIFLSPQVKRSLIISNKLVNASCLTSCGTV